MTSGKREIRHRKARGTSRLLLVLALVGALVLAACGSDDDSAAADESGGDSGSTKITIGWIPWDEDIAVTHLWKHVLEEQGYEVELTNVDVAPLFQGLADGDIDLFFDSWVPDTHGNYWEEYADQIVDLGTWFDNGTLNLAVPEYVDLETFDDLVGNAEMFDGRIVGIEPGAGTMRRLSEEVMPGYGLDEEYQLVESSTPTMLTELETAIENEEPIVVVLWHPHWAYATYPIKDLEDTKGLFGEGEEIVSVANKEFAEANPDIVRWFGNFKMDDESLGTLENLVLREYEGDEAAGVEAWLEDPDNAALVQSWIDG